MNTLRLVATPHMPKSAKKRFVVLVSNDGGMNWWSAGVVKSDDEAQALCNNAWFEYLILEFDLP